MMMKLLWRTSKKVIHFSKSPSRLSDTFCTSWDGDCINNEVDMNQCCIRWTLISIESTVILIGPKYLKKNMKKYQSLLRIA